MPTSKSVAQKATSSSAAVPQSPITTGRPTIDWPEKDQKDQKDRKTKGPKNLHPSAADEPIYRGITKTMTGDPVSLKQPMDRSNRASARGSSRSTAAAPEAPPPAAAMPPPPIPEAISNRTGPPSTIAQSSGPLPVPSKTKQGTSGSKTKSKDESPKTTDLIDFLEQHYIRNLSELEARDLIYGKIKVLGKQEQHFFSWPTFLDADRETTQM